MEVKFLLPEKLAEPKMLWSEMCSSFYFLLITQSLISPDALPSFQYFLLRFPLNEKVGFTIPTRYRKNSILCGALFSVPHSGLVV